jgi:hypothetical protein
LIGKSALALVRNVFDMRGRREVVPGGAVAVNVPVVVVVATGLNILGERALDKAEVPELVGREHFVEWRLLRWS